MHKKTISTTLGGLMLLAPLAQATHTGSTSLAAGDSPTANTDSARPLEAGRWNIGLRIETTRFDRLSDDKLLELREADDEADLHSIGSLLDTSLNAAFGINDNLTIGVKLPYLVRDDIREPAHGHGDEEEEHHDDEEEHADEQSEEHADGEIERLGNSEGLGDLSVYGLWRFHQNPQNDSNLAVLFGVKTPTGDTNQRTMDGHKFETELQPGSGSWDPFAGLAASRNFGSWVVNGNFSYTLATEGSQNTTLGDIFAYNGGVAYAPARSDGGIDWSLSLEFNGEWRDKVEIGDMTEANSGGHWLHLSPGLSARGETWSVFASVGLPVIDDPNGYQDGRDYRFLVGVQFMR